MSRYKSNGEKLREIRIELGLDQKQFADIVKIQPQRVSAYEKGTKPMYEFELLGLLEMLKKANCNPLQQQ